MDLAALRRTRRNLVERLNAERVSGGWWEGHLASSALSTATAIGALTLASSHEVSRSLDWLARSQNEDGGWGDTVLSLSNISTTVLCWCAFAIAGAEARYRSTIEGAETWLTNAAGGTGAPQLTKAILHRYGADRTFSVPILTVMAIAGKLGQGREAWREIPQLPFELAACPHQIFGALGLPVVSYALPALIAIGQVRHHYRPSRNPVTRALRNCLTPKALRLLRHIQPSTGGYLEATPLTSFVVMSLAFAGRKRHSVAEQGIRFLAQSMRPDGSWPIDTNLATWITTLSIDALSPLPANEHPLDPTARNAIRDWLLAQQYQVEHPYTHAAPGGWAWTPLPGGVPDADDTPGALLALRQLGPIDARTRAAAANGTRWLLDLQNNDGGMPTFCRGWGRLPFDRSGTDLTAHAVAAWQEWLPELPDNLRARTKKSLGRATEFLVRNQKRDGSWTPLWFGNEHVERQENQTYGTARVVPSLLRANHPAAETALEWLGKTQNKDGGWGGGPGTSSTIEESSLALHALAGANRPTLNPNISRGAAWLIEATSEGRKTPPSPIGLYFASLWYYDDLYPLIFSTGALSRLLRAD
ncbi:MAG: squalene--hopene cyclase [Acidobacteria bacterium]|nr:squalene--hopene cyclase [Acidobacteriota bacterium]